MNYFEENDKLYSIVDRYPETIPVFVNNGFPQMDDEAQREKFAKTISLKHALMLKQTDLQSFSALLNEAIKRKAESGIDGINTEKVTEPDIRLTGLLPCPVRIPLLEQFSRFAESFEKDAGLQIAHELKAASMGLDWVEKNISGLSSHKNLPDIFISAGFDLFFDRNKIGRYKEQGVFRDLSGYEKYNELFNGIDLKDPRGHYSIISAVPAVFLVNTNELGDTPEPKSWKDILSPEFENRVSIPIGDFDLFNAILINIHRNYGEEGVFRLGKSLLESMHPSQMVKSNTKKINRPAVTIMPFFFTKTVKEGGPMKAVWPEDGAILSPIFMLTKAASAEKIQPVVDFFASKEVGETLAHNGLFPSTREDVDNRIDHSNTFMWPGWDYIYSNDIAELISRCEEVFNSAVETAAGV